MKVQVSRRVSFICKSLLWSVLLYMLTVVILDWNEITSGILRNKDEVKVVNNSNTTPAHAPAKITTIITKEDMQAVNKKLNQGKSLACGAGVWIQRLIKPFSFVAEAVF